MSPIRRIAAVAVTLLVLVLGLGAVPGAVGPAGASASPPPGTRAATTPQSVVTLPQPTPARQGAQWLASQLTPQGFYPTTPGGSTADLSATANTVLALSAANVDSVAARSALAYLAANLDAYVTNTGADGPAQLAQLILDTVALGQSPTSFGGTDLVARLLATQQTSGPDAGLFGTEDQVANYAAGGYQQGLALAALAAAGVRGTPAVQSAVAWLVGEQCPDGGWTSPDNANNDCSGAPADYAGPDTNSTALAVQGLVAQGALSPAAAAAATAFLVTGQDADAGWSYYPNTTDTPGVTDPDSTSLVLQALLALGISPADPRVTRGGVTPVTTLLGFQLTSGTGAGAFDFNSPPATANTLSTYEAVPALAGLAVPFGPAGGSYVLVGSDGGVFAFGHAGYYGSLPALGVAVSNVRTIVSTADGKGYWMSGNDGGIFGFGDATYRGSLPGLAVHVNDIVGMVATADGQGYWLVGADGGVFAFGDAGYIGSLPGLGVHVDDIVGIVPTADGKGYWMVGADGGVFAFGDAGYIGSLPGLGTHVGNIVGITPTADGQGYWMVGADGGVFAFGDAGYIGSLPGLSVSVDNIVGIAPTPDAGGYLLAGSTGGVFAFGDAVFSGSAAPSGVSNIVGIAPSPARPA
jgi:hypothetical protein